MKIISILLYVALIQAEYRSSHPWEFAPRVDPKINPSNQCKYSSRLAKSKTQPSYHLKSAKYKSNDLNDVEYTFVPSNGRKVYNYDGQEDNSGPKVAGRSPAGYPSSDFVRYFAKYTSSGGRPEAAPAAYRARKVMVPPYEYLPKPENNHSQLERLNDSKEKTDSFKSYGNVLIVGSNITSRGRPVSPIHRELLNHFYYSPVTNGARMWISSRFFYY